MRRAGRWALALVLAGAGAAGAAAAATPPYADDQLWSEVDVSVRAGPADITALGVVRDGSGPPNPTLAGGGVIADLPLGGGFTLSGGDLWVRVRTASGGGVDVQVPLAAVSYAWRWGGFAFSDRNRAEKLIGAAGDPWRYRNRLAAEHALEIGPLSTPFSRAASCSTTSALADGPVTAPRSASA
jgi:hypothetical protein